MTSAHRRFAIIAMLIAAGVSAAPRGSSPVSLKYFGTAGWEISDGKTVVLIDPYLSRLRHVIPNADTLVTDTRPMFTNDDVARTDTSVVDAHIQRADFILITHSHLDHAKLAPPSSELKARITSLARMVLVATNSCWYGAARITNLVRCRSG
jgi:hypothetical protein